MEMSWRSPLCSGRVFLFFLFCNFCFGFDSETFVILNDCLQVSFAFLAVWSVSTVFGSQLFCVVLFVYVFSLALWGD